jgi:hypothetical protein
METIDIDPRETAIRSALTSERTLATSSLAVNSARRSATREGGKRKIIDSRRRFADLSWDMLRR